MARVANRIAQSIVTVTFEETWRCTLRGVIGD
jgi:hypothetical protein